MRRTGVLVLVLALGAALAAAASAGGNAATVTVKLKEFTLVPTPKMAKAGEVTFVVKNVGKLEHEMVVIRTNAAPGKVPVNAKGRASEKRAVGEVGSVRPGQTKKTTLTLAAGRYVLLCNLPGHYKAGQYSGFVVK
jgi:uncharacterized cupredoxin-like copper-binding protein